MSQTHINTNQPANPPADGYETALVSEIYDPVIAALHSLMQSSGDFDMISTYWQEPQFSLTKAQYPSVITSPADNEFDVFGIGSRFKENLQMLTVFHYRHYKKVVATEGYYYAEKFFNILKANRRLEVPAANCVLKSKIDNITWLFDVEGQYALNEVQILWTAELLR